MTLKELPRSSPAVVAILAFDGVQALDVTGPMEVFATANELRHTSGPPYQVVLASWREATLSTHAGVRLSEAVPIHRLDTTIDTLVVCGGSEAVLREAAFDAPLAAWLRQRATVTRRMASVCTGALVLAAAGLLDGRRATTHWRRCAEMRHFFPNVSVDADAIFVVDPPFYTSAGVTAGIDLCLHLVASDWGDTLALDIARELVLPLRREGGQAQYSAGLRLQAQASPRLQSVISELLSDPRGDWSLQALSKRLAMSERSVSRHFQDATGFTPAAFVALARVERAKQLLASSPWPLERVAAQSGFGSVDGLHRAFVHGVGVTPGAYRRRFGAP